jgi:hypothetical protein
MSDKSTNINAELIRLISDNNLIQNEISAAAQRLTGETLSSNHMNAVLKHGATPRRDSRHKWAITLSYLLDKSITENDLWPNLDNDNDLDEGEVD